MSSWCASRWCQDRTAAFARRGGGAAGGLGGGTQVGVRDREVRHGLTHLAHIRKKQYSLHVHNALFIVYTRLGMTYRIGYIHMNNDVK